MSTANRSVLDLGENIRISPPVWPDHKLQIQPGDLSKFTPYGNGVYGYQNQQNRNPFTDAPSQEPCGGVIYFDCDVIKDDFEALMRILNVQIVHGNGKQSKDFAVFATESVQPLMDGYIAQMRVISKFGLRFMFDALTETEYDNFPEQGMNTVETLWSFIEHERKRWGTSFMDNGGLAGKFGGDGNYAREELSFGFMLENDYHHICRIWSRAWLVTK